MSNVFTLESLEEEIEREYAPLRFKVGEEEFTLRSLLRVDRNERDQVLDRLRELEKQRDSSEDDLSEDDALDAVQFVLKTVTADDKGDRLTELLGNDLLVNMKILERWTEVTQPGEATHSPTS